MKATCIKCWDADALVTMDLDGSGVFRCGGCSGEFDRDEVTAVLEAMQKGWAKLIAWADAYPKEEPAPFEARGRVRGWKR